MRENVLDNMALKYANIHSTAWQQHKEDGERVGAKMRGKRLRQKGETRMNNKLQGCHAQMCVKLQRLLCTDWSPIVLRHNKRQNVDVNSCASRVAFRGISQPMFWKDTFPQPTICQSHTKVQHRKVHRQQKNSHHSCLVSSEQSHVYSFKVLFCIFDLSWIADCASHLFAIWLATFPFFFVCSLCTPKCHVFCFLSSFPKSLHHSL